MTTFPREYIEKLNKDIEQFPQVKSIETDYHITRKGVGQLVMLDRYAFKDTEKKTLTVGDFVVVTAKEDPKFPARGLGWIEALNDDRTADVRLLDEYVAQADDAVNGVIRRSLNLIDKPLEIFYEQIAYRVARGLAAVEKDEKKREQAFSDFYREIVSDNFVPAGRVLYGAGSGTEVTYFNCFSGDTIVQTKDGSKFIKDLRGWVDVLSLDGKYRKAYFRDYGEQELFEITLENGEILKATAGHEWYYNSNNGLRKTTTLNLEGKRIPIERKSKKFNESEIIKGIKHGIVYGDGTVQNGKSKVMLFGNKIELVRYFHGEKITPHYKGEYVGIYDMPSYLKELPSETESESYWHGFIMGLIATDGYVDDRGSFGFHSKNLEDLRYIISNLHKTNFAFSSLKKVRDINPFSGEKSPCYKVQLIKQSADDTDFIRSEHYNRFVNSPKSNKKASIKVVSVRPLGVKEVVYCCNEPETHSFVVGTGYLTGNCYVMPFPKDSREGIAEHRGKVMEIMSRGGGVGTNGSTLRPRHALARGVNGRSSGAVSWLNDIAQLTHLVEQGGSRRGAQMIMLADWHPDIIEFIISKMQNPRILRFIADNFSDEEIRRHAKAKLKFTPLTDDEREIYEQALLRLDPGSSAFKKAQQIIEDGGKYSVNNPEFLTGANISVAITHEFMKAVERGDEYELRFPDIENYTSEQMAEYNEKWHEVGDVREWHLPIKTYRKINARELWQLICFCATYSAEPGIFFIDNANDMTNAKAYGQKVVATNPCGEQPLAPYSVCNLAAVNLANMADKANKTVDWAKLKRTVAVGVRMQDNVIDATPYFLEENRKQALGERRIGLGVMGLHDLLLYCGLKYGSPEANDLVDKVFETIATTAYRTSIELAKEKGPFPYLKHGYYGREIGKKIKELLENGEKIISRAAGRFGEVTGVSNGGRAVYIKLRNGTLGVTTFDSGDAVYIERQSDKYVIKNIFDEKEMPAKKFVNSGYMKCMPEDIRQGVLKHGIRNSHLLTVAPTGSTGTMIGVSTGLEPYFSFKYYRSGRLGKFIEVNADIVEELGLDGNNLPDYFVSAMDLTPEQHADTQCVIQRWVDSSISKTVNAPRGYSVEQVQQIYERLYRGGAKGGTVYVDGSRDAQVLSLTAEENRLDETDMPTPKVVLTNTVKDVRSTNVKYGSEVGDTCPICREGTIEEIGGCSTCTNCGAQLKCGL